MLWFSPIFMGVILLSGVLALAICKHAVGEIPIFVCVYEGCVLAVFGLLMHLILWCWGR